MNRHKIMQWIVAAVVLAIGGHAAAQLTIPHTTVQFRLNTDDWRYLRTMTDEAGGETYLYCYVGEVLVGSKGDTALPTLRIYVLPRCREDIYDLVADRWEQQPYQQVGELPDGIGKPRKGGMGLMAAYTSLADKRDYQFYVSYFKDKSVCVEFRLETTKDTFKKMDFEFSDILGTLK